MRHPVCFVQLCLFAAQLSTQGETFPYNRPRTADCLFDSAVLNLQHLVPVFCILRPRRIYSGRRHIPIRLRPVSSHYRNFELSGPGLLRRMSAGHSKKTGTHAHIAQHQMAGIYPGYLHLRSVFLYVLFAARLLFVDVTLGGVYCLHIAENGTLLRHHAGGSPRGGHPDPYAVVQFSLV